MVKAAVSGQGLALVRNVYADDELRAGRLVQAIAVKWPTRFAYYAVGTPQALQRPAVRRFRDWLVAAAAGARPSGQAPERGLSA
jgi:LysR family glycine cleavage system transcriptional activator